MTHNMKLRPEPFNMIKNGYKTFELRLYDEKRKQIKIGDMVIFTDVSRPESTIEARVIGLFPFESFDELYATLPLDKCGYKPDEVNDAQPSDMLEYYPSEKQQRYGVIAIQIELIK